MIPKRQRLYLLLLKSKDIYSSMSQSWACLWIGQRALSPARVSEKRRCVAVMQQQLQHPPPLKTLLQQSPSERLSPLL